MDNELLRAALDYAKLGYAVFPVDKNKAPLNRHGFKSAKTYQGQMGIRQWWGRHGHPEANVAIAVPDGAVVLDVDPRNGGALDSLGALPRTPTARTGGGGWHLWFNLPAGMQAKSFPGVDVKVGGKGYVVAPPSVTASGSYTWEPGLALGEVDIAPLPEHILYVPERAVATLRSPGASLPSFWVQRALDKADVGNRNNTGLWLARQLRANCFPDDMAQAEQYMRDYQASVPQPADNEYSLNEALATLGVVYDGVSYFVPPAQTTPVFTYTRRDESSRDNTSRDIESHIVVGEEEVPIAQLMDPLYRIPHSGR